MAALYLVALVCSFATLWDYGATRHATGWTLRPGPEREVRWVDPKGPAAGILQPGDRILSLDGESAWRGQYGPDAIIRWYPPGIVYQIRYSRSGGIRDALLRVEARHDPSQLPAIAAYLIGSVSFFGVALVMGWQRPELSTARIGWAASQLTAFVYLSLALQSLWSFGWAIPIWALLRLADRLHMWLAFWFVSEFPYPIPGGRFWPRVRAALAIVGAAAWLMVVAIMAPTLTANPRLWAFLPDWWIGASNLLASVYVAAIVAAMAAVLTRNYRAISDSDGRRRIEIVAGAVLIGSLVCLAGLIVSTSSGRPSGWGNLGPLPIPICIAYAIVKHRVLDLRLVIRRGLRRLFTRQLLGAVTVIPLVLLGIRVLSTPAAPLGSTGNLVGIGLIVAAIAALEFRDRILAWLDRWLFRETLNREKRLREMLSEIAQAESWTEAAAIAESRLAALFPATVRVAGAQVAETAALAIAIPSAAGQAFLVFGPKRTGDPYSSAERDLLDLVAAQMGLIHDNLRLAAERDAERQRLAREVHDAAGHGFAGISLYLEAARKTLPRSPAEAEGYLEEARQIAQRSMRATRETVAAMRSASDLEVRLRALASTVGQPVVEVELQDGAGRAASPDAQWHLARIAEEAVANARKHSSASRVLVDLRLERSSLVLRVQDDGRGFDPASVRDRGYGLTGMRERVAELNGGIEIASDPGRGCEVRAEVPVLLAAAGGAA